MVGESLSCPSVELYIYVYILSSRVTNHLMVHRFKVFFGSSVHGSDSEKHSKANLF